MVLKTQLRCLRIWLSNISIFEITVLILSLLGVIGIQVIYGKRTYDDAFITYRYARNISQGLGFVYNLDKHVLGTTTPLYTLLLVLVARLIGAYSIPKAAFIFGSIADALNVWLVYLISRSIFKNRLVAIIVAMTFLLQPLRIDVASGGMETPLFLTFLLLMYKSYLMKLRFWWTSIWMALAFLTRPDALIAILPLCIFWYTCDRRGLMKATTLTALLVIPWILFTVFYFGSPIPQSIIAKNTAYHNPHGYALIFLMTFLATGTINLKASAYLVLSGFLFSSILLCLGIYILYKVEPAALVMASYPIVYVIIMSLNNTVMWFPWYYVPLIPSMLIILFGAVWYDMKWLNRWRLKGIIVFAVILIAIPAVINIYRPWLDPLRIREQKYQQVCQAIEPNIQSQALVLAPDIGVIGWCLEKANILDPIGLVSPEAISYMKELHPGQTISLHLLEDKQPDYIISFDYFLEPTLLGNSSFEKSYKLVWQDKAYLYDALHNLYVFKRTN